MLPSIVVSPKLLARGPATEVGQPATSDLRSVSFFTEGLGVPDRVFDALLIFCRPRGRIFPMGLPRMELNVFPEFRFSFSGK